MRTVRLQTKSITDWESFHNVFAGTMGFPSFYGCNMNAWIDCMSNLDDPDSGMTTVAVTTGEIIQLEVADTIDFQKRLPEIFQTFIECTTFVNWRRAEEGEKPILSLTLL